MISVIFFAQDISSWDVSGCENMSGMFSGCYAFNQPLNSWNVSKVRDMIGMFHSCYYFNQPLDKWNVSAVENMSVKCIVKICH
nr:BspA family leucine-rich repeat surface protein [uncultured Campylobacter sp.]